MDKSIPSKTVNFGVKPLQDLQQTPQIKSFISPKEEIKPTTTTPPVKTTTTTTITPTTELSKRKERDDTTFDKEIAKKLKNPTSDEELDLIDELDLLLES